MQNGAFFHIPTLGHLQASDSSPSGRIKGTLGKGRAFPKSALYVDPKRELNFNSRTQEEGERYE